MADVRSLLRQQRAARRIEHPHAAYSDAGKLLCALCQETIKSESIWEAHLKTTSHMQRLQQLRIPEARPENGSNRRLEPSGPSKRKHESPSSSEGEEEEDAVRRKRSRQDIGSASSELPNSREREAERGNGVTPPSLIRRASTTPVQGVEIQIPSRPATPAAARDGTSSSSTPVGPSPLIPQEPTLDGSAFAVRRPSRLGDTDTSRLGDIDPEEWAAFEADIAATTAPFNADAVISAPAMTAEESAAAVQTEEEERAKRRTQAELELENEKEDATRALETEFEEMEELEARVLRLKAKRDALRQHQTTDAATRHQDKEQLQNGKENHLTTGPTVNASAELDDDEEDENEDDWVGFRFNA
jgi:zinc finger protein 830